MPPARPPDYSVHHSAAGSAEPALARAGGAFYFLPTDSPELNAIQPLLRQVRYGDLATHGFPTGEAFHAAVDEALAIRAANLDHPTND